MKNKLILLLLIIMNQINSMQLDEVEIRRKPIFVTIKIKSEEDFYSTQKKLKELKQKSFIIMIISNLRYSHSYKEILLQFKNTTHEKVEEALKEMGFPLLT